MREARPAAINLSALDACAQDEHDIGMPGVGTTCTVLLSRTSKLRHRHQRNVLRIVTHDVPKRCNRARKIAEAIRELSVDAALVLMSIPPIHISESSFNRSEEHTSELQSLTNL